MKVDYVSDLHFNHWMRWTDNQLKWEKRTRALANRLTRKGNGEVLVIAGDFGEWNCQAKWILDEVSKSYERIYWTFGNHDLYLLSKSQRKKYVDSINRLNELIEMTSYLENVVPLIRNTDMYKGKVFVGDAMWYLPKTLEDWEFYLGVSNDSKCIRINGYTQTDIPRYLHKQSMDWYDTIEGLNPDVFVSHVPPVHNPHSPFEPNGCYMVDTPFIEADHWICGHDHLQFEFEKVGVKFHMNAIGYAHDYDKYIVNTIPSSICDTYKLFDIKTFEI
jgi:3',5'-cyclic AMP phosphodiesterase CpdA